MYAHWIGWIFLLGISVGNSSILTKGLISQEHNFYASYNGSAQDIDASSHQCSSERGSLDVLVCTFAVGQGDATYVECGSDYHNHVTLIDMGSDNSNGVIEPGEYIRQMMNVYRENRLRHIFITHPDNDHLNFGLNENRNYGLLLEIVNEIPSEIPREKVQVHISSKDTWIKNHKEWFFKFVELNKNHFELITHWSFIYNTVLKPMTKICGDAHTELEIIVAEMGSTANSASMVMMVRNGITDKEQRMLFMGDFEGEANFVELLRYHGDQLSANVVMVPHHGAKPEKLSLDILHQFYVKVNALTAVISSHILDSNRHPKMSHIRAFCNTPSPAWDMVCNPQNQVDGEIMGYDKRIYGENDIGMTLSVLDKCNDKNDIFQTTWINPTTKLLEKSSVETILNFE